MFALTHRCVGAYTSHIALPEAALARIPEGKTFEDAAAFPLAALTAWQVGWVAVQWSTLKWSHLPGSCSDHQACQTGPVPSLCDLSAHHCRPWSWRACSQGSVCWCTLAQAAWAPLRSRQGAAAACCLRFLRDAGSALSSHMPCGYQRCKQSCLPAVLLQLAKARGLWVAATCSGRNADFVKGLGADEVVDYTSQDFAGGSPALVGWARYTAAASQPASQPASCEAPLVHCQLHPAELPEFAAGFGPHHTCRRSVQGAAV